MTAKVTRLEFRGLHKTFGELRNADRRSIVAAYRHGQVIDALHKSGFTWGELGDEVDRSWRTVRLYAVLYNKYDSEQDVVETADRMKTYNVARLAGHSSLTPIQYVMHCMNCGSFEVKKERKQEEVVPDAQVVPVPKFQSAS
jgi:hypothetical protein